MEPLQKTTMATTQMDSTLNQREQVQHQFQARHLAITTTIASQKKRATNRASSRAVSSILSDSTSSRRWRDIIKTMKRRKSKLLNEILSELNSYEIYSHFAYFHFAAKVLTGGMRHKHSIRRHFRKIISTNRRVFRVIAATVADVKTIPVKTIDSNRKT